MNKFMDYCDKCKKDVVITEVNMLTAAANCENGHIWWGGNKYKYVISENSRPFHNYELKNL